MDDPGDVVDAFCVHRDSTVRDRAQLIGDVGEGQGFRPGEDLDPRSHRVARLRRVEQEGLLDEPPLPLVDHPGQVRHV